MTGLLFIQVAVVVAAAYGVGRLMRIFGQPAVIGEMLAGIMLGPSLLGLISPELLTTLFAPETLRPLQGLAQLGVVLFMLLLGAELDARALRRDAPPAMFVSLCGVVLPFVLGVSFAWLTLSQLAAPGVPVLSHLLFLGVAMSITAFPVLARILQERRMLETPLGQRAIACAAIEDGIAWCLLAVVVAVATAGDPLHALWMLLAGCAFVLLMFTVVAPLLARRVDAVLARDEDSPGLFASLVVLVLLCAALTNAIGIHPFFGAFVAGAILPARARLLALLRRGLQPLCSAVLLPLFFALTGLRTEIGLLQGWTDVLLCAAVIALAVAGKFVGGYVGSRFAGMPRRDSLAMGVLLNTRGLMELIVLNIGYDLGLLTPRVFTMFVIMALVTTLMTGPLLTRVLGPRRVPAVAA